MTIKQFIKENYEKYEQWFVEDWDHAYEGLEIEYINHFFGDFSISQKFYDGIMIKILPYLENIEKGFFVECGAATGENTIILENCGWTGLLIEPSDKLSEWCRKYRSSCIIENCALVSSDYKSETIDAYGKFVGTHEKYTGELENISISSVPNQISNLSNIPSYTFETLSDKHNINHVDVFFLDVEGWELEILKGINFEKVNITYFVVEVNTNVYSLQEMDDFMKSKGYSNIRNLSNFNHTTTPFWNGKHQDYLYKKTAI
jgi:FkbM family methyltransferase